MPAELSTGKVPVRKRSYSYILQVSEVVDGDTFKGAQDLGMHVWLSDKRVRLTGVNAPELHSSDPLEAQAGAVSRAVVLALLPVGCKVVIETTSTQEDKYGRLPAQAWIPGTDVELGPWLLKNGLVEEYHGEARKPFDKSFLEAIVNLNVADLVAKVVSSKPATNK